MSDIRDERNGVRDERLARRHDVVDDGRYARRDEVVRDDRAYAVEDGLAAGASRYGGVKAGSAFFGWLTAMGLAVLLTAVLAAAGTAVGLETGTTATTAADQAAGNARTVGIAGAVAIAVILLVSYWCGGYVAGRMARFNGARQGVAVWLWSVVVAVVVGVIGAVAGSKYDVLGRLNSFPRLPMHVSNLTAAGAVALVVALLIALVGAILGGIAGMRFHRRVDRVVRDPY
ncbi:hypothetical protein [Phycicoccus sp. 3266]|jgi:hypothetical protein|uniref:hypothetical protein n=1 Tax=Phycicoccus sp. 3266 TaxID=2817751 RepID=UPI0028587B61|nr:hypothetical protein [Phycicoccus sp. 3266]MDR6865162.1 hypothetical protein [Phycicoccus sp. 3266]